MIPKTIHTVWLSGEKYPPLVRMCMDSWRRNLPGYRIKVWDTESFDTSSVRFVREAVSVRKWAPASDYIRLWALYNEGGIYLDSDVYVRRSLDGLLSGTFFSAIEAGAVPPGATEGIIDGEGRLLDENLWEVPGVALQAAILGSEPGHPFVKRGMEYFAGEPFIMPDGSYANQKLIAPSILARLLHDFGFRYYDAEQFFGDGMHVLESARCPSSLIGVPGGAYAVHCCAGNWNHWVKRNIKQKLYRKSMPLLLKGLMMRDAIVAPRD